MRPTPNRVRETAFNWLAPYLYEATCLDLFAGSGALGIEALSRGAKSVVFVESNPKVAARLQENLNRFGIQNGELHQEDALNFLKRSKAQFDLVFLDPPFHQGWLNKILPDLKTRLSPNGQIYIEFESETPPLLPPGLTWAKQKKAGEVGYGLILAAASGDDSA